MAYLLSSLERAVFEIAILFGGVFALATMMWFASQRLRGDGYSRFGRAYVYFVAPGVICHETGHALGCILTGTRIVEFVPFRLSGNELGHVTHVSRRTFFGQIANFFIGTGPVWFGCLPFYEARPIGTSRHREPRMSCSFQNRTGVVFKTGLCRQLRTP